MTTWYVPSWHGDFRLEKKGNKGCLLTVVKPTPHEKKVLKQFMKIARERGWTDEDETAATAEDAEIVLKSQVADAGREIVNLYLPADRSITAVRYADGRLEVADAAGSWELIQKAEKEAETAATSEEKPSKKKRPSDAQFSEDQEKKTEPVAASVKRPTPSCPQCMEGAIEPATEVLLSFLTPEQHDDWMRKRAIMVEGGLTGHRYVIAHRHSELARQWGRIAKDVDDDGIMHFYDMSVPPEEEVLAAKLVLEHREPWLRNRSTCLGGFFRDVFTNPLGHEWLDGVETARLMSVLGVGFAGHVLGDMTGTPKFGVIGEAFGLE